MVGQISTSVNGFQTLSGGTRGSVKTERVWQMPLKFPATPAECALCTRPRKASGDGVVQRALSCAYQGLHEQRASVRWGEARGRRGGHGAVCRCERREEC